MHIKELYETQELQIKISHPDLVIDFETKISDNDALSTINNSTTRSVNVYLKVSKEMLEDSGCSLGMGVMDQPPQFCTTYEIFCVTEHLQNEGDQITPEKEIEQWFLDADLCSKIENRINQLEVNCENI